MRVARLGAWIRGRPRRTLALGAAGAAALALVAAVLLPAGSPPPGRHHRTVPAPPAQSATGPSGMSAEVASPPTLVPDTAVTVAPAPEAAGAPPAPRTAGTAPPPPPTTVPPPSYPAPKPEADRSAPSSPPPAAPSPGAVTAGDFPDPFVLRAGAVYYAYATQVGAASIPVMRSVDLVHWEPAGNALANLPAWSGGVSVWAPSVVASASGYVLFYSTRDNRTGDQCISRAVSLLPQGPFVDTSANPFVCQLNLGGSIDPDAFVDANGAQWLVWKSQGTAAGTPPHIWAQAIGGDWKFLAGSAVSLVTPDQSWEAGVVEAPAMYRVGSRYYLLYSGNNWDSAAYGVGYAVCRSVTGPCVKPHDGPVLASHGTEAGPGSPGIFTDALGHLRVAYHAWTFPHVGYPGGERSLHFGTVGVSADQLAISEP